MTENGQKLTGVLYDASGNRTVMASYFGNHEMAYLGQNLTLRDGGTPTKHIYAGETLIASKLDPDWFNAPPTMFFHNDHLGSTQYATNDVQELVQHDEFFPTGEVWQVQADGRYKDWQATRFTGKDLDQGSGLYYFGARWYHPRLSVWQSPDPVLKPYFERIGNARVYWPLSFAAYTYTGNNLLRFIVRISAISALKRDSTQRSQRYAEDRRENPLMIIGRKTLFSIKSEVGIIGGNHSQESEEHCRRSAS